MGFVLVSTVSCDFTYREIKWESLSFSVVDYITIQPPPLCGPGPTNIKNSSEMACLERNAKYIVYNISIQQRSCSRKSLFVNLWTVLTC